MSTLEYTLSLNDKLSAKLDKIGISSKGAWEKFKKLQTQTAHTRKVMADMGNSVGSLRQKLDLLKQEKEWIPSSNLKSIRAYNTEIKNLEKEIQRLDTINGSAFKRNLKDAISDLPFSSLLTNPVAVAGAAFFKTGQMAMDFDKGMAAINTTAQLSQKELSGLKKELLGIDPRIVNDWSAIPTAYESIISQTGNVKLSTDILKTSLKGSKAGFTEVETVSAALAQSLSLIGAENANAQQVLDTFFAAKRVGAGEFKDFAQYMPSLIASGDALGIKYKEVAGMFAYMTGKGQSAERATVLMENAFSAMSKVDVRKNLAGAGINIFDKSGSIRSMTDIFGDLKNKMNGMSDEQKSSFLAKMGLTDKEARSAFIVMTSELDKLKESMDATRNAAGETDRAFALSRNNGDRLRDMWSQIQRLGIQFGGVLNTILTPALTIVGGAVGVVTGALSWLLDGMANGDPVVWGLTMAVGAFTTAMYREAIAAKATAFWDGIVAVKKGIMTGAYYRSIAASKIGTTVTWLYTGAVKALSAAWAISPIGLIVAGAALIGAATYGLTKLTNQQTAAQKINTEVKQRAIEKSADQIAELDILFSKLKNAKKGTDEHRKAIEELNNQYPEILKKYDLQNISLEQMNALHKELQDNILKSAMAEVRKEMFKETLKEEMTRKERLKEGGSWNYAKEGWQALWGNDLEGVIDKRNTLLDQITADENKSQKSGSEKLTEATGNGSEKVRTIYDLNTEKEIQDAINKLEEKKGGQVIGSKDYKQTAHEIATLQNKLNKTKGGKGKSAGASSNESIATGGTKTTHFHINFRNMVENMPIQVAESLSDVKSGIESTVGEAMLRVLAMTAMQTEK